MSTDKTDPPSPGSPPTADELEIAEVEALPPLGSAMPANFRERLVLALKTTNPDVLSAAEVAYRGTFSAASDYIVLVLSEHVPEFLHWIFDCVDHEKVLAMYEGDKVAVWTIGLTQGRVMIFESPRAGGAVQYRVPHGRSHLLVSGDTEQ